jgi:hypothetical protein
MSIRLCIKVCVNTDNISVSKNQLKKETAELATESLATEDLFLLAVDHVESNSPGFVRGREDRGE